MEDPKIKYYPVGNGDTTLIKLSDETTILIDINITSDSEDDSNDQKYDIKSDLIENELNKDSEGRPYVNAFILSHPDQDHCRGFEDTFFLGKPSDYSESDSEDICIIINELWFTPKIFDENKVDLSSDAEAFVNEAKRRIDKYENNQNGNTIVGNRLKIIGYGDNPELKGLDDLIFVPGNNVNTIDSDDKFDFSFFIHAPFKEDEDDRNDTSVVLQGKFDVDGNTNAGLAFIGGDSGFEIWKKILDRSDDDDLSWDLFLTPHHCSWSFFNDTPSADNPEATDSSIELLNKKRDNAIVIASCNPIKRNDNNPPHYKAKQEYINIVEEENFLVTGEHPDESAPLPIIFEFSANGPVKIDSGSLKEFLKATAVSEVSSTPQSYGK